MKRASRDKDIEAETVELGANRSRWPFSAHKAKVPGFVWGGRVFQAGFAVDPLLVGCGLKTHDLLSLAKRLQKTSSR